MKTKELVIALYQAFGNRDRAALEHLCDPAISWHQNPGFPGGGVHVGIDAILQNVFEANTARWKVFEFKILNLIAEDDTVVVEGVYVVEGRTHQRVEVQTAHVFTLANGRICKFQQYCDTKTLWDHYPG
ncbi:MAG: nuclear transport factor 2 family protein [Acidobacteria bacterium]|nr:nuclear transport factor 2 family protein [Acidobacteriota bacterium]